MGLPFVARIRGIWHNLRTGACNLSDSLRCSSGGVVSMSKYVDQLREHIESLPEETRRQGADFVGQEAINIAYGKILEIMGTPLDNNNKIRKIEAILEGTDQVIGVCNDIFMDIDLKKILDNG